MFGRRSRTCSESSDVDHPQGRPSSPSLGASGNPTTTSTNVNNNSVGYDLEGKFTFSQVMKQNLGKKMKTTVDENGKFNYVSADMRPVPPGWYDIDKTKHKVPVGWYDQNQAKKQ